LSRKKCYNKKNTQDFTHQGEDNNEISRLDKGCTAEKGVDAKAVIRSDWSHFQRHQPIRSGENFPEL
jgi:hypothetical protein